MTIQLLARLDVTDDGEFVWWAESPDAPGVTVAAASLRELETLGREAVGDIYPAAEVTIRLVRSAPPADAEVRVSDPAVTGPRPAGGTVEADRATQLVAVA
jgi:hypothetical protein